MRTHGKRHRRRKSGRVLPFILACATVAIIVGAVSAVRLIGGDDSTPAASETTPSKTEKESDAPADDDNPFNDFYFYMPEREARYAAYKAANPQISDADTVWRVNVDIDKAPYEDTHTIEDISAIPLLVNKHFKLPDDFVPSNLTTVEGEKRLEAVAAEAYLRMRGAAEQAGLRIAIVSAYRSIEYQKGLYAGYVKKDGQELTDTYSARPAYSEHHTGYTCDLVGSNGVMEQFDKTDAYAWMAEHAWEYGFIQRYTEENRDITLYKSEPWHYTYVGAEAAKIMRDENIGSLEEYFVKYVLFKQEQ